MLSKLLSKALQLWLRSQVSHVQTLELTVHGTNQQLLSGEIPQVDLTATHAVYQELHLSEVALTGKNIKINLRQILRGKPIQLREPISLTGQLKLTAPDLEASLSAPLLSTALDELLQTLVTNSSPHIPGLPQIPAKIHWQQATITPGTLILGGRCAESSPELVTLETGLTLTPPHQFALTSPRLQLATQGAIDLKDFLLDLGSDVAIEELSVTTGQLVCQGQLTVQP
jgi:hypothetical protein